MLAKYDRHQARCLGFVKETEREARLHRTLRQFEEARQLADWLGLHSTGRKFCAARLCVFRRESHSHQPFTLLENSGQVVRVSRVDDTAQFDIVALEHDAPVAGAPLQVSSTRCDGEA